MLVEKDAAERIYFVVETKGSLFTDELRAKENAKILCARSHFQALALDEKPARYIVAASV